MGFSVLDSGTGNNSITLWSSLCSELHAKPALQLAGDGGCLWNIREREGKNSPDVLRTVQLPLTAHKLRCIVIPAVAFEE